VTKLIEKTGDLFTTSATAIGHGVNVDGLMGHGIAVQFKNRFPDMHEQYRTLCREGKLLPGETYIYRAGSWTRGRDLWVYNIASQDRPGRTAKLEWLYTGIRTALRHADANSVGTLALPRIGAGIGGLEWAHARECLEHAAMDFKTDIEVWTLPQK
jgi:O-acetyl-ADP-ribose deacetylase (regulator of RNase III)